MEKEIIKWLKITLGEHKTFIYEDMFDFEAVHPEYSDNLIIYNSRPDNFSVKLPDPNNVEIRINQTNGSIDVKLFCIMRIPVKPLAFIFDKKSQYFSQIDEIYHTLILQRQDSQSQS